MMTWGSRQPRIQIRGQGCRSITEDTAKEGGEEERKKKEKKAVVERR